MKPGDLVKRSTDWTDWIKYNSWMTSLEEKEIGLIARFDEGYAVVLWSLTGDLSWEDPDDLEKV
jgi:hypothetical protein